MLRAVGAEQPDEARRLEPLAVLAAEDEPEIRQHDQDEAVEEFDPPVRRSAQNRPAVIARASSRPMAQPSNAPSTRVIAVSRSRASIDDEDAGESEAEHDIDGNAECERMKDRRCIRDDGDDHHARKDKPGHQAH